MREAGKKQLMVGLVIAGIGLAISVGSYVAAASSSGGGSYFLMFGLVIVGLVRAFRGYSMMRAAGSAAPAPVPAPAANATPAMPAMPPQPPAQPATAQPIETHAQEPSTSAAPPAAPSSSMWD
jgi:hypothetical protein